MLWPVWLCAHLKILLIIFYHAHVHAYRCISTWFMVHPKIRVHAMKPEKVNLRNETSSLVPRPPFNTARGKGGLVNTVQHFCTSSEFSGTIWLVDMEIISLNWASLSQTTKLYSSHFTDLLKRKVDVHICMLHEHSMKHIVSFPDPPPKRKGGSYKYNTWSHYGLAVAMS